MTAAIKFCGGAGTVSGSMHLVLTNQSNVLLDCGLFYGHRDEYYEVNSRFSFNPEGLDACVLSHAHIDHCGNIPNLVKQGFRAAVHCTPATRDLCRYMLPDSGYVQEEDIKYVNKINKKRGLPPRAPLYTQKEAERALHYLRALEYHTPLAVSKDITLSFYEAGHILGSAIPLLEMRTAKRAVRLAYAVDLGRRGMPLSNDPEIPEDIDYLVIEGTYGGKEHSDIRSAQLVLAEAVNKTVDRGGKIIIPSFALERTQLIVFFISGLIKSKRIKKLPIYVDSPLAVNLTEVFRDNWRYFDPAAREAFLQESDPLGCENITYIKNVNDSKRLNSMKEPSIIISASGMCENGRILHHLKNNIENPRNTVIVVGYMAQDTLGKRIVERKEMVRIFGRPYDLRAEVVVINAFSAHADKNGLLEFVAACQRRKRLKKVFIVHADPEAAEVLRASLRKHLNLKPHIPAKEEMVYL